jgi:hypothetical protein
MKHSNSPPSLSSLEAKCQCKMFLAVTILISGAAAIFSLPLAPSSAGSKTVDPLGHLRAEDLFVKRTVVAPIAPPARSPVSPSQLDTGTLTPAEVTLPDVLSPPVTLEAAQLPKKVTQTPSTEPSTSEEVPRRRRKWRHLRKHRRHHW